MQVEGSVGGKAVACRIGTFLLAVLTLVEGRVGGLLSLDYLSFLGGRQVVDKMRVHWIESKH